MNRSKLAPSINPHLTSTNRVRLVARCGGGWWPRASQRSRGRLQGAALGRLGAIHGGFAGARLFPRAQIQAAPAMPVSGGTVPAARLALALPLATRDTRLAHSWSSGLPGTAVLAARLWRSRTSPFKQC